VNDHEGETSCKRRSKGKAVVPPGLTTITDEPENETLKKLRLFKQFDIVVDTSDHHYVNNNSSMKHVSWFFFLFFKILLKMYFVSVLILTIWVYILPISWAESIDMGEKNPARVEDFGEAFAGWVQYSWF
jgi:hypothetical protein